MSTKNNNDKAFYIGLCMAGAVSAGAYTAGVIDYLLEALDEWEKRRGEDGVPQHKVQIPVMGGASAGGMTSIMAASSLNNPIEHFDKPTDNLLAEHPENKLYHSWVDLTDVDMFSRMLDTSDIKDGMVASGLNSDFIDPIAKRVVGVDVSKWQPLPNYITPGLKLFTTLTNLEGFSYTVDFGIAQPGAEKYYMVVHNDVGCFQLTEDTIAGSNNGWIPLNLKTGLNAPIAGNAAMATGAFPVGLKSRLLDRDSSYVNANKWLKDYISSNPLPPGNYNSLNVDGGLINNEPFEKVRDVLNDITKETPAEYEDFNKFTSTVLMIEPFPTTKPTPISKSQRLLNVVGLTLSAMISQMRAKPINIANAMNKSCAGQFLITPTRIVTDSNNVTEDIAGERAIACGALDGFSGFINKEFRVHDYFLGRYNCKIFLRDYFTVPESALVENEFFRDGYANANKNRFQSTKEAKKYQIIPVFDDTTDYSFPDFKFISSGTNWPVLQESDIDKYNDAIKKRVEAVLLNIAPLSKTSKFFIWAGAKVILNKLLTNAIIGAIKDSLKDWKLL